MASRKNYDPGFTNLYEGHLRRVINKDGSFNVRRVGTHLSDFHIYQILVSLPWVTFFAVLVCGYLVVNALFAGLYMAAGIEHLAGANMENSSAAFLSAFFFSTHTFTTVGYGTMYPVGLWTNIIASMEAMVGLMSFAIATGLLYGRFSRATARLVFSTAMTIAPHKGGEALMFRVANRRQSTLMEVEARLLLMTVVGTGRNRTRKYDVLDLEVPTVHFLPLSWTVVHPLTATSPLHGKNAEELAALQAEVLVLIKGFDDRFQQTVHARYSYRHDEIVRGMRFAPAFHVGGGGDMVLDLRKISDTTPS